jgi:P4 family phage/plasmid primase-like protien
MIKISELNLCKILVDVKPNETKTSGKDVKIGISGWQNMTIEELNEINERRINNPDYNQYYIKLNREYMVFDTDDEFTFKQLTRYLEENDLYNYEAITRSFRGKTKNIYYKRHFWFKVTNQRQFKHIKEEGQIKFGNGGGELFFGNKAFISEFTDSIINNVPVIDISIYNDIVEILNEKEPELKSQQIEKVYIVDSDEDDNEEPKQKPVKPTQKLNTNNNTNTDEIYKIIDGLAQKRFDDYNYWLIAYFIICNEKIDMEIFKYFSMKTTKIYNEYENEKILKSITPKKGYTIATFYFWLKEDNIELFKELCKTRTDFWKIRLNNVSIADFYYQINPDSYIYTYNQGWYEYNENNILVHRGEIPISLTNGLGRRLQEIATEQRNFITPDNPKYKEYMDIYNKFFDKVGSNDFIKSVVDQMKQSYYVDIMEKINNINILAFNNVLYDYTNNTFRKIKKDDYIIKTTGYDLKYKVVNNNIVPIRIEKINKELNSFIMSLFEDEELFNYWFNVTAKALFGNEKEQKFYIFSGKGSNGKSLTQKLICNALGQYYKSVSNNFLAGSIKKGGADPELASCIGVRYLSISEPDDTEGKKFNVANLKNWSGGDKIQARELYGKKMLEFYAQFTLFINCNDLPELTSTDDGLKRRVRNIHFPFQFKDEKYLKDNKNFRLIDVNLCSKLINSEYIQEFILMLLERAFINKNDLIKTPESIINNSNKYCDENNILYNWFTAHLIKTDDSKDLINSTILLNDYNASEYFIKKLSPKDFSKFMEKLGNEKIMKSKLSYYTKLKFVANELDD